MKTEGVTGSIIDTLDGTSSIVGSAVGLVGSRVVAGAGCPVVALWF